MALDRVPLIAIGMPVYNGARFVETAVQSLLRQTEPDFLLLISDDCSTDKTPEICARLGNMDHRIRVVRQNRRLGMTANFRYVLRETRSSFFMWAAQDDIWEPEFVSETLRLLTEYPDAIGAMTAIQFVGEHDDDMTIQYLSPRLGNSDPVIRAVSVATEAGYHAIYSLFRREMMPTNIKLEDVPGQDLIFVFGLSLYGRFVVSDRVLSTRRLIGYETVEDSRGRLMWRKALGPSGHLYTRNPHTICRGMLERAVEAPISIREKARLFAHIAGEWSRRVRERTLQNAGVRTMRAASEREYGKAIVSMLPAAIVDPRGSWRVAKAGLPRLLRRSRCRR